MEQSVSTANTPLVSTANTPLVSAVIVTYNGLRWLPRLFDSLLPQLAPYDAQVLLVDNGSTDGSGEFARAHYPQVTVLSVNPNRGPIPAINRGLAEARGKWIFVLNDDLEFQAGVVAAMLAGMQDRPAVGIASPILLDDEGAMTESYGWEANEWLLLSIFLGVHRRRYFTRTNWEKLPAVGRWRVPYLQGACLVVRKSALDTIGPMDENFYMFFDEVDWCRRFRQAGWDVALLNEARVVHFGSPMGDKVKTWPLRQSHHYNTSLDYFARKYYGRRRAFLVIMLYALIYIKAMVSLWVRTRLPRVAPGSIVLDRDSYRRTQAHFRSLLRDVLQARGRAERA